MLCPGGACTYVGAGGGLEDSRAATIAGSCSGVSESDATDCPPQYGASPGSLPCSRCGHGVPAAGDVCVPVTPTPSIGCLQTQTRCGSRTPRGAPRCHPP